MALRAGIAYVDIGAKVSSSFNSDVEKGITPGSEKAGEKAGGILGSSYGKAAAVAVGGFAVLKAKDFLAGAMDAARESAKVTAQTEAVIKSTGGAANVSAKQFGDLAGSISKVTGIDDEAIQSGENLLATFTNVRNEAGKGNDIFNQATHTLVDMGAALGGDASSSAIQLGKALNDPVKGITALTRVGVTFTQQQKDQIAAMQASGDTAGAQKVILAELTKEFGGSAAAQATAAGKFSVAWGNFQEKIGGALIPIMDKFLTGLMALGDWVGSHTQIIIALGVGITAALVPAFVAWAAAAIPAAAATVAAAAPVIALGLVVAGLAYVVVRNWDTIKGAFDAAVHWVGDVMGKIGGVISGAWHGVQSAGETVIGWFRSIPGWIGDAMKGLANIITAPYRAAFNAIAHLWNSTVGKLSFHIPSWVPKIGGKGFDVPNIPEIKGFDFGGIVGGPVGAPQLILAHGGETLLPTHRDAGAVASVLDSIAGSGRGRGYTQQISVTGQDRPRATAAAIIDAGRNEAWLAGADV